MSKEKNCKFIFVTGGVVSSLGKGITAASIGNLMENSGFKVIIKKLDPYLNIDPGTISPTEHGEVFVTDDGLETDLDLGHYERFTSVTTTREDSISSGRIYSELLEKERRGDYLGKTIQVIPHITKIIKNFITNSIDDADFTICEIGGTVGDIEALPFIEAIRQVRYQYGPSRTFYVHVTLVPYLKKAMELKTKPTQHSVKNLLSLGVQPDMIICRSELSINDSHKEKIAKFCNIPLQNVIPSYDVENIYKIPLHYKKLNVDKLILTHFGYLNECASMDKWENAISLNFKNDKKIKFSIVGKYTGSQDIYFSLIEAIKHSCMNEKIDFEVEIVDSELIKEENVNSYFANSDSIIVPGGFGSRGIEGKIIAIKHARTKKIPFLGICLGMQLAVIEFARNVCKIKEANSTEFAKDTSAPLVSLINEWDHNGASKIPGDGLGGTMRLGSYECKLEESSVLLKKIYGDRKLIKERHRHRYEINPKYISTIEEKGELKFVGQCNGLMEIVENSNHPWFLGVQFHPEFKSRLIKPNKIFISLAKEMLKAKKAEKTKTSIKDEREYSEALEILKNEKAISISYIQRKLRIGYNKAANIVERMEEEGIIGPPNRSGKREIICS